MSDLRRTIENFARQLRSKFRAQIERDTGQFKRNVVAMLRRSLPASPGRPRAEEVTRAALMREQGKSWQVVYSACLPLVAAPDARQLAQSRLRSAVRARRRRYRTRTKSSSSL